MTGGPYLASLLTNSEIHGRTVQLADFIGNLTLALVSRNETSQPPRAGRSAFPPLMMLSHRLFSTIEGYSDSQQFINDTHRPSCRGAIPG